MLNSVDLTKTTEKAAYKEIIDVLEMRMSTLQRQCKALGIPVLLIMDGLEASGKGVQIGKLMKSLDPRGFRVYSIGEDTKEEKAHPFLWKYWTKTPAKGEMVILDSSWYRKVTIELFDKEVQQLDMPAYLEEIRTFEKQLVDGGTCLVKLFLYIDAKEQKSRMEKLLSNKSTEWRVTKKDIKKNRKFDTYAMLVNEVLKATNTDYAPWEVISAMDRRYATIQIYTVIIRALEASIKEANQKNLLNQLDIINESFTDDKFHVLQSVDLNRTLAEQEYADKLEKLQKKIEKLHGELYRQKVPMILGFEGWDAAGKGGAIRRLTEKMDPRGYVVYPIASPTPTELAHHYLWRFWKEVPKDGHIAIFDRTWYGRVMVERIEGFCTSADWKRAYKEMNDMEASFVNAGAIVLKFWLHIDKDVQEERFQARQENPEKQWKITEEDWRNRAKWDDYNVAVNEMIERTSTKSAPWIIIEGNDKLFARIKVLETVVEAMEARLK
ncbi:MAG: polyphosphate:AMP phosphotransferase [Eubacteriales bacterium]